MQRRAPIHWISADVVLMFALRFFGDADDASQILFKTDLIDELEGVVVEVTAEENRIEPNALSVAGTTKLRSAAPRSDAPVRGALSAQFAP